MTNMFLHALGCSRCHILIKICVYKEDSLICEKNLSRSADTEKREKKKSKGETDKSIK